MTATVLGRFCDDLGSDEGACWHLEVHWGIRVTKKSRRKKRLCVVVSSPMTAKYFLLPHLASLASEYEITLVANFSQHSADYFGLLAVRIKHLRLVRRVRPFLDVIAVVRLWRLLRWGRFDAVISVTPKAGLVAAVAAFLAGVPTRIHWFTGQVWATSRFPARGILKAVDRLIVRLITSGLVDGPSQLHYLRDQGIEQRQKLDVLLKGSISGVNPDRFKADGETRTRVRNELGIPAESPLILCIGRVTRDKGVLDLAYAFAQLRKNLKAELLFVGPDEGALSSEIERIVASSGKRVTILPETDSPEKYFCAADLLCVPSYREGFGTAVLEGAACGLPSIVSDVYGLKDSSVPGRTGLSYPVGNREKLVEALSRLAASSSLRASMGEEGRAYALGHFSQQDIVREFSVYVEHQLNRQRSGSWE